MRHVSRTLLTRHCTVQYLSSSHFLAELETVRSLEEENGDDEAIDCFWPSKGLKSDTVGNGC